MTITPERMLIVLHSDGPLAGQVRGMQMDGIDPLGRSVAGLPVTAEALAAFLPTQATHLARIADLEGAVAAASAERDNVVADLAAMTTERDELQARVTALEPPTVDGVPQVVTNYQARAALLGAGLLDTVNAALKSQGASSAAYQAWEYANQVYRRSPLIVGLGQALGLDDAQIDALFVAAAQIE